jgi:hypothetical protein
LETTITIVSEAFFFDEYHCIWVWVARSFAEWIQQNEEALLLLSLTNWQMALNQVLAHLVSGGYLRIGTITFIEALSNGYGGEDIPIDKLSLIAPYIALTSIVCVGFVVASRKFGERKRS